MWFVVAFGRYYEPDKSKYICYIVKNALTSLAVLSDKFSYDSIATPFYSFINRTLC